MAGGGEGNEIGRERQKEIDRRRDKDRVRESEREGEGGGEEDRARGRAAERAGSVAARNRALIGGALFSLVCINRFSPLSPIPIPRNQDRSVIELVGKSRRLLTGA